MPGRLCWVCRSRSSKRPSPGPGSGPAGRRKTYRLSGEITSVSRAASIVSGARARTFPERSTASRRPPLTNETSASPIQPSGEPSSTVTGSGCPPEPSPVAITIWAPGPLPDR